MNIIDDPTFVVPHAAETESDIVLAAQLEDEAREQHKLRVKIALHDLSVSQRLFIYLRRYVMRAAKRGIEGGKIDALHGSEIRSGEWLARTEVVNAAMLRLWDAPSPMLDGGGPSIELERVLLALEVFAANDRKHGTHLFSESPLWKLVTKAIGASRKAYTRTSSAASGFVCPTDQAEMTPYSGRIETLEQEMARRGRVVEEEEREAREDAELHLREQDLFNSLKTLKERDAFSLLKDHWCNCVDERGAPSQCRQPDHWSNNKISEILAERFGRALEQPKIAQIRAQLWAIVKVVLLKRISGTGDRALVSTEIEMLEDAAPVIGDSIDLGDGGFREQKVSWVADENENHLGDSQDSGESSYRWQRRRRTYTGPSWVYRKTFTAEERAERAANGVAAREKREARQLAEELLAECTLDRANYPEQLKGLQHWNPSRRCLADRERGVRSIFDSSHDSRSGPMAGMWERYKDTPGPESDDEDQVEINAQLAAERADKEREEREEREEEGFDSMLVSVLQKKARINAHITLRLARLASQEVTVERTTALLVKQEATVARTTALLAKRETARQKLEGDIRRELRGLDETSTDDKSDAV
jgi:hypothetical protein